MIRPPRLRLMSLCRLGTWIPVSRSNYLVKYGACSFDEPGANPCDQVMSVWTGSQFLFGWGQNAAKTDQNHIPDDPGSNSFGTTPQVLAFELGSAYRDFSFWPPQRKTSQLYQ
jgi:hypothetical protein